MKKAGNFENNEESLSLTSKKRIRKKKEKEMKEHAQKKKKNEEHNNEKNNIEKIEDNDGKEGNNEEDEKKGDNFYNLINELEEEDTEINENENKANSNPIKNIKELSGALGLKLINKDIMEKEEEENKNKNSNIIDNQIKDIEKENLEEYKNKIIYYNNEFNLLKQKCNTINQNIEEEKSIRDNYKKLLEDISMQTFSLTENNIIENESKKEKNNILDEIYDVIYDTSSLIDELDKIIYNISNSFGENIENLLNKIH